MKDMKKLEISEVVGTEIKKLLEMGDKFIETAVPMHTMEMDILGQLLRVGLSVLEHVVEEKLEKLSGTTYEITPGIAYKNTGEKPRNYLSIFGELKIYRPSVLVEGEGNLFFLDELLELPCGTKLSYNLQDLLGENASENDFRESYNPKLPQFKTMMATLDTEINGFAFPLASVTVPGNTADDVLYLPVIEHCKASLGEADNLLMVGDKKLGSKQNRAYIVKSGANYLCPLSKNQVSKEEIIGLVKANEDSIEKIKIEDQQLGRGFEQTKDLEVTIEKEGESEVVSWTERQLVFRSDNYANAQIKALENIINKLNSDTEDQIWAEFEIHFNQVHNSFFQKLSLKFPNVTIKDKRLCAFLIMNLTTKEIVSPGTEFKAVIETGCGSNQ